jgi:SAM-dependent methyltransferase
MEIKQTHQNNAVWWNETAVWYGERDEAEDIEFLRAGGTYLLDAEQQLLGDLAPWCKRAIHLQCSHGRGGLSLLRQGASEVVGVDISERLLAVARRKGEALGARAVWVHSDVLETPHDLDGTADLVYTGQGALCWMMDIGAWAQVVARLLVPNGLFFVYESHPLDWVWDTSTTEYTLDPEHGDYFAQKPREQLFSQPTQSSPRYRQWTLGEIINSLIGVGLTIEHFMEYPDPFWDQFQNLPVATLHRLPHAFALLARKR